MEMITAEQAAEAAKGLTFEKVWAAMMEDRRRTEEDRQEWKERMEETKRLMRESDQEWKERMEETKRLMHESDQELKKRMEESVQETQKQMRESERLMRESDRKLKERIVALSENVGGIGNSLGQLTESMFSNELWKKFSDIGIPVTSQSSRRKFCDYNKKVLAEVDLFIENGECVIAVEVKTVQEVEFVKEHLKRIEIVRRYLDERGDKRKIIGAVAGGIVPDNVLKYAQKQGLYVVVQNGDSVSIVDVPQGFKAREW